MNNDNYYRKIVKQYINAEISSHELAEMMVQIQGMDFSTYDPDIYKKSKRRLWEIRNASSKLFNKTTVITAALIIALNIMVCTNRVLDGHVTDIVQANRLLKGMMAEETVLIAIAFVLSIANEVKMLHRLGIRVLSLDFFRLNPCEMGVEDLEDEDNEEEE